MILAEPVTLPDGTETIFACEFCGIPCIPRMKGQRTCGALACQRKRETANCQAPHRRPGCLARARRWYERNKAHHRASVKAARERKRAIETGQPAPRVRVPPLAPVDLGWRTPAPSWPEPYLRGGGMTIAVTPHPRWPVEHRNVRQLHGMMTALFDRGHRARLPTFALVPVPGAFGWGVYAHDLAWAEELAGREVEARLYDRRVLARFSGIIRAKAPRIRTGRHRLELVTVTPVYIRCYGGTMTRLVADAPSIIGTLGSEFPRLVGVDVKREDLRIEVIERETYVERTPLGGKYGTVPGWCGRVVLECNAPAAWLLRCAETLGLGSRSAFGFGRIKVREC